MEQRLAIGFIILAFFCVSMGMLMRGCEADFHNPKNVYTIDMFNKDGSFKQEITVRADQLECYDDGFEAPGIHFVGEYRIKHHQLPEE
jgi:hypothetical protein